MMKRKGILFGIAAIALLSGCKNNAEGDASKGNEIGGNLTVWTHPFTESSSDEKKMWSEMISDFEDKFNVDVTFQQIPWANRDQKILTALSSNKGPDVFYLIPDQLTQFASEGIVSPLSDEVNKEFLSDFDKVTLESASYDGKLYGLPVLQDVTTMIYDKNVIEAIGEDVNNLPETWEEFGRWAQEAKDSGYYGLGFDAGGSMNGTFYPFLWQAKGDVITPDGEVKIDSKESKDAFNFLNTLYKDGFISKDSVTSVDSNALFESGKLLAIQGTGIMLNNLDSSGNNNYIVAPPLKGAEQKTYGTTGIYVTPSNSKNKKAAVEFIKFVTDTKNQQKFNTLTHYIPTRESAKSILEGNDNLQKIASYSEYVVPGVLHPKGRTVMPLVQAELQAMLTGEKTPTEAADDAAKAIKKEVEKP